MLLTVVISSAGSKALAQSLPSNLPIDPSNFDISGIDPALIERIKNGDMSAINDLKNSVGSSFTVPTIKVSQKITSGVVKAVGLAMEQKPMEPATPLGTSLGLNAGIVVTATKLPADFLTSLQSMGIKSSANLPPALPTAGIIIQKGLGDSIDIGGSYLKFKSLFKLWSANAKIVLYHPEEGLTWAIRMNYTSAKVLIVSTQTYSPQLIVSRQLAFADPYLGIGAQYIRGTIDMDIPTKLPDAAIALGAPKTIKVHGDGSAYTGNGFIGIRFVIPRVGLMLGFEGSYSLAKAHSLGVKLGLSL